MKLSSVALIASSIAKSLLRPNRLAAFIISASLPVAVLAQSSPHWLTGYYAVYDQNGTMSTAQLDYTKLSHVIYWPVIPNTGSPGTLDTTAFVSASTFASGATDIVSRAHAAGAKALIGIGGDDFTPVGDQSQGATAGFQVSTTPAHQAAFISNIIALMQQYGFDGVDINWEQIQTSDNSDFTTFISNLRSQLNAINPNLLLTMAPETKMNGGRPDLISQVYHDFNQINIQTYQMSGPYCGWETWYNSPLKGGNFVLETGEPLPTISNAITDYTSTGVPIGLLAMGLQFDSVIWQGGSGTSTGGVTQPHQTWTNDASNCGTNPAAPAVSDKTYRDTIADLTPANGYTSNFDSTADQTWLSYDPSGTGTTNEANDTWVSLDSPVSIAKKGVDLSTGTGQGGTLGGAFVFELSDDFISSAVSAQQHPLLNASAAMQMLLPGLATGFSANSAATSVSLTWTAAPFASSYKVYDSTSASTLGSLATTVTGTSATISGLSAGTLYYFTVVPTAYFGSSAGTQTSATTSGATPTATLSPSSFAFQSRAAGTTSTAASFTLKNTGASTLTGIGISLAGANPTDFTQTTSCGSTLAASATCTISVFFAPVGAGNFSTALTIVSSAPTLTSTVTGTGTSAPGSATLTPSSFAFQSRAAGTTSTAATFTLKNTGATALSGIAVSLAGANPADFTEASGCGTSLAASATCTISIEFAPASAASFTTTLTIVSNAPTLASTITGTGTAPAGTATLSPATFAFQSRAAGSISTAATFTLSNTGTSSLSGISISLAGANPGDFTKSTACGTTLAAGTSCTIGVQFAPVAAASFSTTLTIASSAPTLTSTITGNGTPATGSATLTPTTFSFQGRAAGTTSSAATFTLKNTGTATLTGIGVSLAGANPSDFLAASSCGTSLAAAGTCTIGVQFAPAAAANYATNLTIVSSAPTLTAAITGTGTPASAAASLSPTTFTFQSRPAGTTSAAATFTLTNTGTATLTGIGAALGGANPGDFLETSACGTTLAVSGTCKINVQFAPTSAASFTTTLAITSNAPTITASITGTATAAAPSRVVWVPDFYSGILNVRIGSSNTPVSVSLPSCNPNSVVVNNAYAFVLCSAFSGNVDKILVYDAPTIRSATAGTLNVSPLQTYLGGAANSGTDFNGLIAGAFDPSGNLWVTSTNNNLVLSISAASLGTANPVFTQQLNDSPSNPAGITFASDGSAWLTGLVGGAGIALNFPPSQFGDGGQTPRYCLLAQDEGAGSSCQLINGVFESPEGIAIVNGDIWVANNGVGGTTPGRQIVDLKIVNGALAVNETFGDPNNASASQFVCPGALFSTPVHLWLNDESYGEPASNLHCGGNGDVAGSTGGVFAFTPGQLTAKDTSLNDTLIYANITGRPGFGGIFVENDQ